MNSNDKKLQAIPTNIITGFLGVGKTTAILQLLQQKPQTQRWAVLVNEFGEIGVDGSLFEGQHSQESGVFIREVPGGCMCCAAGLPMQIALNLLLTRAEPHRLLIEPTGLGHPREVLETLSAAHYRDVLDIQKSITLVDARKLRDTRYTEHKTFNQQIDIADIVVGNKQDLYQSGDNDLLRQYVAKHSTQKVHIVFTEHGKISPELLNGKARQLGSLAHRHLHQDQSAPTISNDALPECGYLKIQNEGEGYQSIGWRFSAEKIFDRKKLYAWLNGFQAERLKAVFITDQGNFGYNATADTLTEVALDDCLESKIEIIFPQGKSQESLDPLSMIIN